MLQLRLVDPSGYTASLRGEPAEADAARLRAVLRDQAEALGGEATVSGRNSLSRMSHFDARSYRVVRTQL